MSMLGKEGLVWLVCIEKSWDERAGSTWLRTYSARLGTKFMKTRNMTPRLVFMQRERLIKKLIERVKVSGWCSSRRFALKMALVIFYWPWSLNQFFLLVSDSVLSMWRVMGKGKRHASWQGSLRGCDAGETPLDNGIMVAIVEVSSLPAYVASLSCKQVAIMLVMARMMESGLRVLDWDPRVSCISLQEGLSNPAEGCALGRGPEAHRPWTLRT